MDDVKADLDRRLLDEAARILGADGADALSLRKLAAAAGTSTMAVYTRFGDKPRLLAALYRDGFARLGARLRAPGPTGDPLADLAAVGVAYREAALAARYVYGLMFSPADVGYEPSEHDLAAAAQAYEPLVEGVRRCVAAGVMAGDVDRIALHLWAVSHGMVGLELSGRVGPVGAAEPAERYTEALFLAAAPFLVAAPFLAAAPFLVPGPVSPPEPGPGPATP